MGTPEDRLKELDELRERGVLTDDEVKSLRATVHHDSPTVPPTSAESVDVSRSKITRSRTKYVVAVVMVGIIGTAAFLLLRGGGGRSINGTIALHADADGISRVALDGGDCEGDGGYSDLTPGAQVTVTDEGGKIVGTGELGLGSSASRIDPKGNKTVESLVTAIAAVETVTAGLGVETRQCEFSFEVKNLPRAKFYKVSVGHRNGPSYSYDDLDANAWKVALTIGD